MLAAIGRLSSLFEKRGGRRGEVLSVEFRVGDDQRSGVFNAIPHRFDLLVFDLGLTLLVHI